MIAMTFGFSFFFLGVFFAITCALAYRIRLANRPFNQMQDTQVNRVVQNSESRGVDAADAAV